MADRHKQEQPSRRPARNCRFSRVDSFRGAGANYRERSFHKAGFLCVLTRSTAHGLLVSILTRSTARGLLSLCSNIPRTYIGINHSTFPKLGSALLVPLPRCRSIL